MHSDTLPILLGIFGPIVLGCAILLAARLLWPDWRSTVGDQVYFLLNVIAWTLIWCGTVLTVVLLLSPVVGIVFLIVLAMILNRRRVGQQYALLSAMTVAAERMMPLAPVIDAHAAEARGVLGWRARRVATLLRGGQSLPDALQQVPGTVPKKAVSMIRVGYESGALAEALRTLVKSDESQDALWGALTARLLYVLGVIAFMSMVVTFMVVKIAPEFQKIFIDFDADLPYITLLLFALCGFIENFAGLFIAPFLLAFQAIFLYAIFRYVGWIGFGLPGFRWVERRLHTAMLFDALALVAERQLPIVGGIGLLANCYPHGFVRRRLRSVSRDVQRGGDWCDSLLRRRLIGQADAAVLQAGSRVGNLAWTLREMADSNRRRLAYRLQAVLQILFPVVILSIGLMVMFFVVSFFLPLVQLIQALT